MRSLRIAFCGSSGTGKTTLAEYVSKRYDVPYNPVGSRSVAKAMGFESPYDVDAAGKRGEFQRRLVLDKCAWETREAFVTDRTTFDNIAYTMLHDVHSIDASLLESAIKGASRYTHVILCPMSEFFDVGTDPARVKDRTYHELFEVTVAALARRYLPETTHFRSIYQLSNLEERQAFLRSLLG